MKFLLFCSSLWMLAAASSIAAPREYFVSIRGDDTADGSNAAQAFRSIGHGVSVLRPGDTLTILPGEYAESVTTGISGTPDAPITIRAQRPRTVLMRGDVDVSGFRRVPGTHYTWVAEMDRTVQGIGELPSGLQYAYVPSIDEVEYVRASWHQDPEDRRLYINTSDDSPPDARRLAAGITPPVRNGGFGLLFTQASDLTVEGIGFSGYLSFDPAPPPGANTRWGLYFMNPERVTVRNCVAFFNGGGIGFHRPVESVIEDCLAFGNGSPHRGSGGNIIAWGPARDTVLRRNTAHSTFANGIRFYGGGAENCSVEENIAWDCAYGELWIKGGDNSTSRMTRNVTLGFLHAYQSDASANVAFMASGSGLRDDGSNLLMGVDFDADAHFAAPFHHDVRLQSDSPLRGTGPDGSDPGAHPYRDDVFFVAADGNDQAAGTSVNAAWKTIDHAMAMAKPGHTIYLLPGVYEVDSLRPSRAGRADAEIHIRGREPGVVLRAATPGKPVLDLSGLAHVRFEQMEIRGDVVADGSRGIRLSECAIAGAFTASGAVAPSLRNSDFGRVVARGTESLELSGCRFSTQPAGPALEIDPHTAATLYSERNAFTASRPVALMGDTLLATVSDWRHHTGQDTHSVAIDENAAPTLLAGHGPMASFIGRTPPPAGALQNIIEHIRIHSVTATTANIEWWTPRMESVTVLEWGSSPECEHRVEDGFVLGNFHTASLTGLEPGKRYYIRPAAYTPDWEIHFNEDLAREQIEMERPTTRGPVLEVQTAEADPAPRTYVVAKDGDNRHDGLSRASAWQTIAHAAHEARPGDTILIHEGEYEEFVPVRATGDEGRPVTFKAAPGERVWMQGSGQNRPQAFFIGLKHHIILDGLYFRMFRQRTYHRAREGGAVQVSGGSNHVIRRCFYDGRAHGYMPYFLFATSTRDLLLENNVVIQGWQNAVFWRCPHLRLENNAFYLGQVGSINIWNEKDQPFTLSHNLFCDLIPNKAGNSILGFWDGRAYRGGHNLFFSRRPEDERIVFSQFHPERQRMTLPALRSAYGPDAASVMANPGIRVANEMKDYGQVTAEYQRRELHREGGTIHPLDFQDFFVDPEVSHAHAAPGRVIGPDPEALKTHVPDAYGSANERPPDVR